MNHNYEEMYCDKYEVCKGMTCPNYDKCKGLDTTKEEKNKKTLINTKIEVEELEKYSKIIVKKALKVISCNGSIYAIKLLENKDLDTLKDLQQEIALQIILDGYIITKNAYKTVRKYIYNYYEKTELEIFTNDTEKEKTFDDTVQKTCYISFLNDNNKKEVKKAQKIDLQKLYGILSDTEKKVFYYYFLNNIKQIKVAEMLEKKRCDINNYIKRIKEKAKKCILEGV